MMPESMKAPLKHLIVDHEGYSKLPYLDTLGNITIGIGYNLTSRGLPDTWINEQYTKDVDYFYLSLCTNFTWYTKLNEARQMALIDMCFMGYKKFLSFKKMIKALENFDYKTASQEMLSSLWATQVKRRADELANIMLTGEM